LSIQDPQEGWGTSIQVKLTAFLEEDPSRFSYSSPPTLLSTHFSFTTETPISPPIDIDGAIEHEVEEVLPCRKEEERQSIW